MGIKITRKLLDRYYKQKREIPLLERELVDMRTTDAGIGSSTIFDYRTGQPIPQSVAGFDGKLYDHRRNILEREKAEVKAVEDWIQGIPDGQTRCVFRMFYMEKMTWEAIAKKTGYSSSPDYPRLHIRDDYLKKCKIF